MSSNIEGKGGPGQKKYEDFLIREYDNIAQAHFNTVSTISSFFKHYLLIVSLPIPLFAWLLKSLSEHEQAEGSGGGDVVSVLGRLGLAVPLGAILVAVIGFCVMCYIANLRFDAILYARTVNGIRKYFSGRSGLPFEEEARVRVLPRSKYQPRYTEPTFFLWVVLAFALVNATYFGLGAFLLLRLAYPDSWTRWSVGIGCFGGFERDGRGERRGFDVG